MTEKRFVAIDNDEVYYITDTKDLKTLDDYIKEFNKAEYEFTEEEALSVAKEEYYQMIYENSMSAKENVDMLNALFEENEQLKTFLGALKEELSLANRDNTDLEKENEQLKGELRNLRRLTNEVYMEKTE